MAYTYRNCGNFDLQTALLLNASANTPAFTTGASVKRSHLIASMALNNSASAQDEGQVIAMESGVITNDAILGFYIYFEDSTPSASDFFRFEAGANNIAWRLRLNPAGTISIVDAAGTVQATSASAPFSDNTLHRVECYFNTNSTTGFVEVFVDGTSVVSATSIDTESGGNDNRMRWIGLVVALGVTYIQDWYLIDNVTDANDRLGEFFVHTLEGGSYRAGDALDVGTDADFTETPYNGTNYAAFTDSAQRQRAIDTDGTYPGPLNRSGIGDIIAATWYGILARGNGSSTTQEFMLSNTGDYTFGYTYRTVSLSTSPALHLTAETAANVVPTSTEEAILGFRNNGARDFEAYEMWVSLLSQAPGVVASFPPHDPMAATRHLLVR